MNLMTHPLCPSPLEKLPQLLSLQHSDRSATLTLTSQVVAVGFHWVIGNIWKWEGNFWVASWVTGSTLSGSSIVNFLKLTRKLYKAGEGGGLSPEHQGAMQPWFWGWCFHFHFPITSQCALNFSEIAACVVQNRPTAMETRVVTMFWLQQRSQWEETPQWGRGHYLTNTVMFNETGFTITKAEFSAIPPRQILDKLYHLQVPSISIHTRGTCVAEYHTQNLLFLDNPQRGKWIPLGPPENPDSGFKPVWWSRRNSLQPTA
jgi:hypothetical protein